MNRYQLQRVFVCCNDKENHKQNCCANEINKVKEGERQHNVNTQLGHKEPPSWQPTNKANKVDTTNRLFLVRSIFPTTANDSYQPARNNSRAKPNTIRSTQKEISHQRQHNLPGIHNTTTRCIHERSIDRDL
jgi:hypothetical protein